MPTWGADLAAVNGFLWGYEIKSDSDTLNRLPLQIPYYDKIFDYSVVVAAERHLSYVRKIVPTHWGLQVVAPTADACVLKHVRKPRRNPHQCVDSLIRLLWKREAIRILRSSGTKVSSTVLVWKVWEMLRAVPRQQLDPAIREALKARSPESLHV